LSSTYSPNPGYVYFSAGQPINAQNGDMDGLDALYSLFGWVDGSFEFTKQSSVAEKRITKSRMGIILEGMKLLDDGLTKKIGPASLAHVQDEDKPTPAQPAVVKGPLVDYMYVVDEEDFFDGEPIVEEGKHGNWVWVILEGVVDIVKETDGGRVPIIRLGDGSFIGSMASFLLQGHIRTASAVAVGNVQLGVLDSQRLAQEYAGMSYGFREFLTSLDRRLKSLTNRAVAQLFDNERTDDLIEGQKRIFRQGADTVEKLYLIKQGQVSIVREGAQGPVILSRLGEGDFFGQLPFMDIGQEPQCASVYASDGIELVSVDGKDLQDEYNQLSMTFKNIVDNMATCMIVTADLASAAKDDK
jgi:CRP-like cAMP-binding protein